MRGLLTLSMKKLDRLQVLTRIAERRLTRRRAAGLLHGGLQSPLRHAGAGRLIVSLRRAGPAHAHGTGACAVHARPPRVAARRVRRAGLASPAERRRATAAVTGGEVRLVARRGAHVDAGEQAGTARRTVSLRGAPAMAAHADAPGLVRRIADRAIATAPAGALHRAGLAGAVAAAATVAD